MQISDTLIDELLKDTKSSEDLLGDNGLLKQLTKRLVDRMLAGEMTDHLGYSKYDPAGKNSGNSRNDHGKKKIITDQGKLEVQIPRDTEGTFEPQLIPKNQTRFPGFDEKVISLYARGMTNREIQGHLEDLYGVEVSPMLITNITDIVMDEVKAWQNRPLDAVYPILFMDALHIKIRDQGQIISKAIHLVLGITMEGKKDILGIWITENEGAKFWLKVLNDLKSRGVKDVFIACVDGLKGFPEAIEAAFPKTQVQLCIVHLVRNSLKFVPYKDYKEVCADLKEIYRASTMEEAERQLTLFSDKWDNKYPSISQMWLRHWENIIPFFAFPKDIRKVIYTTNAIESVNRSLRKIIKHRGAFPNDDSVMKLLYLALKNISKKWTMPIRNWKGALNQFSILYEERMPLY